MAGRATPARSSAAFLVALRAKGETVGEIVGFRDAVLANAQPLAGRPDGARHRRHRRRPVRHGERLDHGVGRRRGRRRPGGQARQQGGELGVGVVRRARRARASTSTIPPERVAAVLDEVGITFAFAALFHPGFKHAGPDARRARHPDGVQLPRSALQPGASRGVGGRRRPARQGAAVRRACSRPAVRRRWCSAATTGSTSCRRPGHSHVWEVSRGEVHEHDLDPGDLGHRRAPRSTTCAAGTPRTTPRSPGACSPARRGRCATSCCSTPPRGSSRGSWRRMPRWPSRTSACGSATQMARAAEAVDSGAAIAKLDAWVAATKR